MTWLALLVEDDDSLRRALARAIRHAGLEADEFVSAEALLARGVPESGACLVLDVDLPGMGGIQLKRELVAAGCDLPTIFITAHAATGVDATLAALRPVAVLYKPFDIEALLEAIGETQGRFEDGR
jgi:FixJ family two-component response regulator